MIGFMMLPWWGWVYLLIVMVAFVAGFFVDREFTTNDIVMSVFSFFSICTFVIGFFNPPIVAFLGLFIIPMTALGIYSEFSNAIVETQLAEEELAKDPELDEGERVFLLNIAIGLNALLVVPGYAIGIILCFNVLGIG